MEEKLHCIECRYQYNTREGTEWTKWFVSLSDSPTANLSSLQSMISIYKERDKAGKQKLKHEYRIAEYVDPGEVHAFSKMYKRRANKAAKEAQSK